MGYNRGNGIYDKRCGSGSCDTEDNNPTTVTSAKRDGYEEIPHSPNESLNSSIDQNSGDDGAVVPTDVRTGHAGKTETEPDDESGDDEKSDEPQGSVTQRLLYQLIYHHTRTDIAPMVHIT